VLSPPATGRKRLVESNELYGLPLDRFTAERDALARRLKSEGKDEEAGFVKSLRKPNLAAWTVNQLARRYPEKVRELVAQVERIETGRAAEIREASLRRKQLIAQLMDHASTILAESSHSGGGVGRRVGQTLLSAVDEDTRRRLIAGTLERDIDAGFASLSSDISTPFEETPPRADASRRRAIAKLEREAGEAQQKADRLTQRAEEAERVALAAAQAAARARATAEELGSKVEELRREAD